MFQKVTDRIYYRPHDGHTDRPNIGLILGDKYTLLFDAGNSAKNVDLLKAELAAQGLPEPDFVAVSHWHWDHTFGMHAWGVPTIAGRLTNEQLKVVQTWAWDDRSIAERVERREDIVFDGRMIIDLGGITCEMIHAIGPHADDSVICYVPLERFVFLGDSNSRDIYGHPWHFDIAHEKDMVSEMNKIPYDWDRVDAYLKLLDGLDFTRCIGGHADVMTREELYESFA